MMLRWFPDLPAYLKAHPNGWWFITVGVIVIAYAYSKRPRHSWADRALMIILALCAAAIITLFASDTNRHVPFEEMFAVTCVYGSGLYAIVFDALRSRAARLTITRGDKWIKELDYPYLFLGAVGLMVSINKLDVVSDRRTWIDLVGPLIVATAVVIRLLKTRADIEGWNKPGFSSEQKTPMTP
jgi:peptidoglycan/LPS O-acetylase OafA/YrhL